MQKKKLNKILILAVALIWGVVVFKFAAPYFTPTETVITADVLVKPSKVFLQKKDTFNLELPQRDPFLGKSVRVKKTKTSVAKPIKKVRKPSVPSNKNWPRIEFLGFVKSSKSKSRLGLVRINGTLKRVRNGSKIGEVTVVKIEERQISLSFQKETKTFNKAN